MPSAPWETAWLTAAAIFSGSPAGSIMLVSQPTAFAAAANRSTAYLQPWAPAEQGMVTFFSPVWNFGLAAGAVGGISPEAAFTTSFAFSANVLAPALVPAEPEFASLLAPHPAAVPST